MLSHAIDGDLLVIKADGTYTTEDIRATFAAALSDLKLPPNARLLIDGRESRPNPSRQDVEIRLGLLRTLQPLIAPVCAVVVSTPLQYGLARMYQAGAVQQGGPHIEVFKDIREAKHWLLSQVAVFLVAVVAEVGPWLTAAA